MTNIWKGRKYLKLEHCSSPWYTTKGGRDRCLKHYFTIAGWSLALRIVKTGYKVSIIDQAELMFAHVSPILTKLYDRVDKFEDTINKAYHDSPQTLYCYNTKGELLGSIDDLHWMFKHNCVSDPIYRGVAFSKKEQSYIGYSHRAIQTFKIGDRLFDQKYTPKESDYEEWQWAGFVEAKKKVDERNIKERISNVEVDIEYVVPYTLRGSKTITTLEEARQAAYNFHKEVS